MDNYNVQYFNEVVCHGSTAVCNTWGENSIISNTWGENSIIDINIVVGL